MSFPKYPAYKPSGIEWLGEVPAHWIVAKTARYFKIAMGQTILKEDLVENGEWPVFSATEGDAYFGYINEPQVRLNIGDLVIPARGNSIGAIKEVKEPATTTQTTIYCKNTNKDKLLQHFVYFYMRGCKDNLFYFTQTAIPQITVAEVGANPLLIPPYGEQSAIAAFLTRETAKIDALVAEQQKLIALLKEKRQAVISHAVTKGLDPSVPTKDSGVEWLGEVPAHWEVAAVNYRYEVLLGKMLDEKRITGNHLAPYLRNADVQWDHINIEELPQMDFSGDDIDRYSLLAGDLLVCEGGDVGRSAIWQGELEECYYQKALHRLRPRNSQRDISRFQFYLLNMAALLGVFTGGEGKSTIAHLTAETLRRYRFAYPPSDEQEQIIHFLNAETTKFGELIAEAQSAIALLQERRTALISAAVTGKMDVRHLA